MGIESAFQKLGLAEYESRALAALVRRHDATAQYVSDSMNIPYTKIYHVLEGLENRGLIKSTLERPKKYRPLEPENIIDAIISKKRDDIKRLEKDAKDDLKDIKKAFEEGEHFQGKEKIWYLPTEKAVWDSVVDFVGHSKREAYVCLDAETWKASLVNEGLAKAVTKMDKHGVKSYGIIPTSLDLMKTPMHNEWLMHLMNDLVRVRVIDDSKITYHILVVDDEKVGFSFKDLKTGRPNAGMVLEDKSIARGTHEYFNHLWNQAIPIDRRMQIEGKKIASKLQRERAKIAI